MIASAIQQSYLLLDQRMDRPLVMEIAGGSVAIYSTRNPAKDAPNEDAAAVIPFDDHTAVLAVADGLGGLRGGEHASAIAVEALDKAIESAAQEGLQLRAAILNGIEAANSAVCDLGIGAATTLAVVEIHDAGVRPYHVGDSIILVTGQRGKLKLQTVCHSPVGFAVEAGLLDEREAMHHEDRHIVSNVVGLPDMRIEIGSMLPLHPRDTLLLSSDGLFDNLHTSEIIERLRCGSLDEAAVDLSAQALKRMTDPLPGKPSKPDDLTFVAFRPGR